MKQSALIFGALLIAFFIFITVKDQLPAYFNLFVKEDSAEKVETKAPPSAEETTEPKTESEHSKLGFDDYLNFFSTITNGRSF